MKLAGKTALVAGATRGAGRAIAVALKIVTFGAQRVYMTDYQTTIGRTAVSYTHLTLPTSATAPCATSSSMCASSGATPCR